MVVYEPSNDQKHDKDVRAVLIRRMLLSTKKSRTSLAPENSDHPSKRSRVDDQNKRKSKRKSSKKKNKANIVGTRTKRVSTTTTATTSPTLSPNATPPTLHQVKKPLSLPPNQTPSNRLSKPLVPSLQTGLVSPVGPPTPTTPTSNASPPPPRFPTITIPQPQTTTPSPSASPVSFFSPKTETPTDQSPFTFANSQSPAPPQINVITEDGMTEPELISKLDQLRTEKQRLFSLFRKLSISEAASKPSPREDKEKDRSRLRLSDDTNGKGKENTPAMPVSPSSMLPNPYSNRLPVASRPFTKPDLPSRDTSVYSSREPPRRGSAPSPTTNITPFSNPFLPTTPTGERSKLTSSTPFHRQSFGPYSRGVHMGGPYHEHPFRGSQPLGLSKGVRPMTERRVSHY